MFCAVYRARVVCFVLRGRRREGGGDQGGAVIPRPGKTNFEGSAVQ